MQRIHVERTSKKSWVESRREDEEIVGRRRLNVERGRIVERREGERREGTG